MMPVFTLEQREKPPGLMVSKTSTTSPLERKPMEGIIEKFTIKVTGEGVEILSRDGKRMHFSAGEALMLLDVLRNEEPKLRQMADEASPIPIRIKS